MKPFFSRNINNKGRVVIGLSALALLGGSAIGFAVWVWLGLGLLAAGGFVALEAMSGWCALRACGIKTRV